MKNKSVKQSLWLTLLSLLAIIALSSSSVNAITLADLLAGGSITVSHAGYQDLIFYNFSDYTPTANGGASIIPASDIIVTTRDIYNGEREMGLRFSVGGMLVTGGQFQDIIFSFDVRTGGTNPDTIIDDYLDVSGGTRGNGTLYISETVGNETGFIDNLLVYQNKLGGFTTDTAYFAPQNYLHIIKDIHVFGGTCEIQIQCVAAISDFSQLFSQPGGGQEVPEPMSMVLFGLGLAGLGVVRRKRISK